MKQIAIIEDDQRLLRRLSSFLNHQEGLECVITATSLGEFFERLDDKKQPGLLLLDIELSETINTIFHLQKIRSLLPDVKILLITGHNHPEYLIEALRNGAHSFYLKGSGLAKLVEAIEATFAGGAYLDPDAAVHMIPYLRNEQNSQRAALPGSGDYGSAPSEGLEPQLSSREQEVARGLMNGNSYQEIAESLNLSLNTVRHYVKALYKKFEVGNKVQLSNKLKRLM